MIRIGSWSRHESRTEFRLLSLIFFALALQACGQQPEETDLQPRRVLERVSFDDLTGWNDHAPGLAIQAFLKSCDRLPNRDPLSPLGGHDFAGPNALWSDLCNDADILQDADAVVHRQFFEERFQVYAVLNHGDHEGLFTGYFEPELEGSLAESERYNVPLLRLPDDLLLIELAGFSGEWPRNRISGRLEGTNFLPYYSRSEIDAGALEGRNLEILWVDDAIDKFFLQIQGSGRVKLDDGRIVRVGYAGQNGHPYRAIGRDLIEQGELARENVSLQTIDAWLRSHPDKAEAMMHNNQSYIFFQLQNLIGEDDGPLGAQSVSLTAERSLAIDRAFLPLGIPVWLQTTRPRVGGGPDELEPFNQLMITQDTGGAIKGPVRGDVFWGAGDSALEMAGRMKSVGRYFILLPRALSETS